jgi:hypothetical protein
LVVEIGARVLDGARRIEGVDEEAVVPPTPIEQEANAVGRHAAPVTGPAETAHLAVGEDAPGLRHQPAGRVIRLARERQALGKEGDVAGPPDRPARRCVLEEPAARLGGQGRQLA